MKITVKKLEPSPSPTEPTDLVEFADKHGLEMLVTELPNGIFSAHFKNVETKLSKYDGILESTWARDSSVDEALASYAKSLECRLIVVNAYGPDRREITVPRGFSYVAGTSWPTSTLGK